jgi:predicted nucleic-acid-binding Zn-ribbon protein
MKSEKCPKCGGDDVRFQKGISKRDDLRVSAFSGVALCDYICGRCGYVESYVEAHDLETVRKKVPVAKAEAGPTT